ncbi:glycosyltransferase family 4 protein [Aeromonas veronii]|uniref:glycosyltransferase family 4 protein n=2 Tax=Bacteria TaxID=2 RepID=UPI003BA30F73
MRKKILVIIPSFRLLSPVKVAISIANGLADLGNDVYIYAINSRDMNNVIISEKVNLLRKPALISKYDIVHSHCFQSNVFSSILYIFFRRYVKFVTTVHTDIDIDLKDRYPKLNFILSFIWKWAIKSNHIIFCLNNDSLSKFKGNNEVKLIPNGICSLLNNNSDYEVPISIDLQKFINDDGKIILGMACVVREVKGLDRVAKLLKHNKNFKLLLLGDGPYMLQFQKLVTQLDVDEQVYCYGFTGNPLSLLKLVDVAVFPSYSEGFPLALVEAMSIGLPCVTSNISSFTTFLNDEIMIVDVDNVVDFSHAIEKVFRKKSYYSQVSLNTYNKLFTIEAISKKYDEAMNEIFKR